MFFTSTALCLCSMTKCPFNNISTALFKSYCFTRNIGTKCNFLFTALGCHLKCICAKFSSQPEPNFNKFKSILRQRNLCNGYPMGGQGFATIKGALTLYHKSLHKMAGSAKTYLLHIVTAWGQGFATIYVEMNF